MSDTQIRSDLGAEAERILDELDARGMKVKLLGGIAIQLALGDRIHPALKRECGDIDLFTTKSYCSGVESMLEELGWEPAAQFNALNGARRLLFSDPATDRKIDGFIDDFEMCHKLPLARRFDLPGATLSPSDLLLTKLQIIELNAKDRGDCYALLLGFPVTDQPETGNGDAIESIDLEGITSLTSKDWGLQHTLELNLERLRAGLVESPLSTDEQARIGDSITAIETALENAGKSRSWKLRARVGERKKWYDEPEEIE
ncbi:MAG: nucleotidyltransferase family protein [Actinomycetota bacterium]|nr:nucleotidyltransferase family protein [Actinomycetota bacterium]